MGNLDKKQKTKQKKTNKKKQKRNDMKILIKVFKDEQAMVS